MNNGANRARVMINCKTNKPYEPMDGKIKISTNRSNVVIDIKSMHSSYCSMYMCGINKMMYQMQKEPYPAKREPKTKLKFI
jgi:hypothetical protein